MASDDAFGFSLLSSCARVPSPCSILPLFLIFHSIVIETRERIFDPAYPRLHVLDHSFVLCNSLLLDSLPSRVPCHDMIHATSFRIHLSPRSRRTSQAKRAQMAAANANAAASNVNANVNAAAVAAATNALAAAAVIGTDRSISHGVGPVRRVRGTSKRDREIYTPSPPASPEVSNTSQNGMYGGNGNAGGSITLHPVPERSGSGADSYGNHAGHGAGSYGSVPSLSYPGGTTSNGHHTHPSGHHHSAGNGMVSPSSVTMPPSNYGAPMNVTVNPYGVYAGQTEGPVMLFSPTEYPHPPHPNTHSHSTRDREGNGSSYPSPLSATSSNHSPLNGGNGGGAGGHPGMHRSNSYASHHSSTHNSPYHSAVNIHSGSHVSLVYSILDSFFLWWLKF